MANLHQELEQQKLEEVLNNMTTHDLVLFALRYTAIEVLNSDDAVQVAYLSAIETNDVQYPDKDEWSVYPKSADVTADIKSMLRVKLEAVHRNLMFEFI